MSGAEQPLPAHVPQAFRDLQNLGATNVQWFLRKMTQAEPAEQKDLVRIVKYAHLLSLAGARVTFVKEQHDVKTPDLKASLGDDQFFLEVRKFRSASGPVNDPASSIVAAVHEKRKQLPAEQLGLVALDSFNLQLQLDHASGLVTHGHIQEALSELQRSAVDNPKGWERPAGVILFASAMPVTAGSQGPYPHFIWLNPSARPALSRALADRLQSALPGGQIFHAALDRFTQPARGRGVGGMTLPASREAATFMPPPTRTQRQEESR